MQIDAHWCWHNALFKTEVMHFPPLRVEYSNADTSRFNIRNADGSAVGFVDFTNEFKYLGSIIDSSLTSDADVDKRIQTATSAYGALKNVPTYLSVDFRVKKVVLQCSGLKAFTSTVS
jgi:hypothetical protein